MEWHEKLKTKLKPVGAISIADEHSIVSSVIVPIGWNKDTKRNEILLTKRTETVQTHKGQVGFPGGIYAAEDKEILRTAIRECNEEIGVKANSLEILGMLSPVHTVGKVLIFPFVAKMEFPYPYVINKDEVAKLLYLPLEQLLEEDLEKLEVDLGHIKVPSKGTWVDGELVWGASARMLEELQSLLR
jgi:8-oxo-dGTP pyrophosphatase MutT (NUDIX family)